MKLRPKFNSFIRDILSENYISEHDLIVIKGEPSPQSIYLTHRKDWSVINDKLNHASLELYREAKAAFLITKWRTYADSIPYLPVITDEKDFRLCDLSQ